MAKERTGYSVPKARKRRTSFTKTLPPAQVAAIRQKSREYRRFRRSRAEVSLILRKILAVWNQIQELRREAL